MGDIVQAFGYYGGLSGLFLFAFLFLFQDLTKEVLAKFKIPPEFQYRLVRLFMFLTAGIACLGIVLANGSYELRDRHKNMFPKVTSEEHAAVANVHEEICEAKEIDQTQKSSQITLAAHTCTRWIYYKAVAPLSHPCGAFRGKNLATQSLTIVRTDGQKSTQDFTHKIRGNPEMVIDGNIELPAGIGIFISQVVTKQDCVSDRLASYISVKTSATPMVYP